MDAQIRIADGRSDDLIALREWLSNEDELRGRVRVVDTPPGETELGALPELLTVALGAGGAGTVLASSIATWLRTRRTSAKVTIKSGDRSVTLEIETADDLVPLLREILGGGQEN